MFAWISWIGTPPGTPLTVEVVDTDGEPVATASVRFHDDGLRRRVNHRNGRWRGRTLVEEDGTLKPFAPGDVVPMTVVAPGHLPQQLAYTMEPHKNVVQVQLQDLTGLAPANAGPTTLTSALLEIGRADCDPTAPGPLESSPMQLDPNTVQAMADLEKADPELTTQFAETLLASGPEHLDAALAWADIAEKEAHTVSGDAFVELIEDLHRVRAVAHHVRWLQDEHNRVASGAEIPGLERHRAHAEQAAAEWLEWARSADRPAEAPLALCTAAASSIHHCG